MAQSSGGAVLVCRFSALGDVAMTIPVLYSECLAYPDRQFVMLTKEAVKGLFIDPPANLAVVGADLKGRYKGLGGMWRLYRDVSRRYKIAQVVDLHDVLRTKALRAVARLHGIPSAAIDKGRSQKRELTRHPGAQRRQLPTSFARYADAFARAGLPAPLSFASLFPQGAPSGLYAAISTPKAKGERWIGIAPFAAHQPKIYPVEMLREVAEALLRDPACRIFIFGAGGAEQEVAESWASSLPRVASLAGKRYGFEAEMALMSHLDAMVTMDSANMHLASIAGAPVVSIWGPTHPCCGFAPWRQPAANMVQRADLGCRPCSVYGQAPCRLGTHQCMRSITPAEIADRVRAAMNSQKTDSNG